MTMALGLPVMDSTLPVIHPLRREFVQRTRADGLLPGIYIP